MIALLPSGRATTGLLLLLAGLASSATVPGGSFTVVHHFHGRDGADAFAGLLVDGSGGYYGVTSGGGAYNHGTVFHVDRRAGTWAETVVYSFTGKEDGAGPYAGLVGDARGNLYGVAREGPTGYGSVFALSPPESGQGGWSARVLHAFAGGRDGAYPAYGTLARDRSGALYGTTERGGAAGEGTVFALEPPGAGQAAWTERILHAFTGGTDGKHPMGGVTLGEDGALYGATADGGVEGRGTLYAIAPPSSGGTLWSLAVIHQFAGADGSFPVGAPVPGPDGAWYGTTARGGSGGSGTIYRVAAPVGDRAVWDFQVVHAFAAAEGGSPYCGLAASPRGALYGSTAAGGAERGGSVFALQPPPAGHDAWAFATLHSFAEHGGEGYKAGCVALAGGTLLGGTEAGGDLGDGTLYELAP